MRFSLFLFIADTEFNGKCNFSFRIINLDFPFKQLHQLSGYGQPYAVARFFIAV